ncbi:hypothetical protein DPMN_130513 [Dreissena polymorpha]|uniref:Uncharacterized protein n=1 Tax=Dreissena polymorpha TaxID=45954 RepID=A0A9D4H4Q0_DREPO|nr:hypothetical protein DPMN_130513 [Dreissena polymorpha]
MRYIPHLLNFKCGARALMTLYGRPPSPPVPTVPHRRAHSEGVPGAVYCRPGTCFRCLGKRCCGDRVFAETVSGNKGQERTFGSTTICAAGRV